MSDWLEQHIDLPFAYLTTLGRNTGDPHRIEIWFGVDRGRVFLLSGGRDRSDWVKNLIADPRITIEINGKSLSGTARILDEGTLDDQLARALLVTKYQKTNELEQWGKESLAIIIDLESTASN